MQILTIGEVADVWQGMVTSGAGAGRREGDWELRVIESGDIQDDRILAGQLRTIRIERNVKTEKHLLKPYDVVVTARSTTIKVGLVQPALTRVIAGSTLLVVRSRPELAVGLYLWYFFTSSLGRSRLQERVVGSTTISSLTARNLQKVVLPWPSSTAMTRLNDLIEESERAYAAAMEAAELRRTAIRDAIIATLTFGKEA